MHHDLDSILSQEISKRRRRTSRAGYGTCEEVPRGTVNLTGLNQIYVFHNLKLVGARECLIADFGFVGHAIDKLVHITSTQIGIKIDLGFSAQFFEGRFTNLTRGTNCTVGSTCALCGVWRCHPAIRVVNPDAEFANVVGVEAVDLEIVDTLLRTRVFGRSNLGGRCRSRTGSHQWFRDR